MMADLFKRWRWALLIFALLVAGLAYAFWPVATLVDTGKVTRGMVRIFGNLYFDSALSGHHGEPVFIGYDIHDAERVWVRDRNQALIAVARLDANKSDYRPQTALEHAHATRAKGRLIRLERHLDEVHLELTGSRPVLEGRLATPEEQAAAREYLAESAPAPLGAAGRDEGETGQRPRIFRSDLELWQWVQDHPALANDQDRAYLAECLEDEDFRDLIAREAQKKSRLTRSAARKVLIPSSSGQGFRALTAR